MTPALLLDTEASGQDPTTARLVSAYVSLVDLDDPQLNPIREQEWVAWPGPGFEMPADAAAVNGYTTERLRTEATTTTWEAVLQIIRIMEAEGLPVVAYNAAYDLTLLYHEALRASLPTAVFDDLVVVDSYVLWMHVDPNRKGGRKLIDAIAAFHIHLPSADYHEARFDAIGAGMVAQKLLANDRLRGIPLRIVSEESVHVYRRAMLDLQAWKRRTDPTFSVSLEWPIRKETK